MESSSKQFEESVQTTMTKRRKTQLDDPFYYGALKFQVPIQFNID